MSQVPLFVIVNRNRRPKL